MSQYKIDPIQRNQTTEEKKKNTIRTTFIFQQEDWEAMGFSEKPEPVEMKRAVYDMIHTVHTQELPEIMGAGMAAHFLNLNPQTVKRYAQEGKIPAYKENNRWKFRKKDLIGYLEEHDGRAEQAKLIRKQEKEQEELRSELRKIQSMRHHNRKETESGDPRKPIQRDKKKK